MAIGSKMAVSYIIAVRTAVCDQGRNKSIICY